MTSSLRVMRRIGMPFVLLALVAAACSGAGSSESTAASTTPEPPASTTAAVPGETTVPETTSTAGASPSTDIQPEVAIEGPPAPDFTLALADGTDFVLSEEQKPVFMVFWAEW